MSDGVSISSGPQVNPNVLMEILGSSASVQDRIVSYQKAKEEHDKAFEQLRIGRDAKKAYEDANAKTTELEVLKAKARDAADAALNTLSEAQERAKSVIDEAVARHAATMAEIERAKQDHAQFVANSTADLETKHARLNEALASVEQDKAAAVAAQKEALVANAAAARAKEAHDAAVANLRDQAAKLQQAAAKLVT